jgi:threonine dehydrogenase-like Zn-dependent dehydrogenase
MKALVYTGTQELIYRDEKNPTEVDGESILKVYASGICGSDMHAYHGHDERRVPPLIIGHEVSGQVQNGKFKDKDVVLNPLITCGKCNYCINGREHLCPKRVILGMNRPIERQGVFAEYVTLPIENMLIVPDEISDEEAVFAEPLAAAFNILQNVEISKQDKVVIIGDGKLGQLIARAVSTTSCDLTMIGKHEKKIELKILPSGSPRYCYGCKKVIFRGECKCKNKSFDISSSLIRSLKDKKKIKLMSNF